MCQRRTKDRQKLTLDEDPEIPRACTEDSEIGQSRNSMMVSRYISI